ncbi:putative bifunctional diguanylate cyclase/phosphodiesterase [Deinococcus oregonensis]|uniref:Bifunctional diguanylate cyclase/phosphodiesterase n=1 Tax=Deinococcus oregonensis TaxID=1805970 RepID=A0ABV6B2G3_9DEIO
MNPLRWAAGRKWLWGPELSPRLLILAVSYSALHVGFQVVSAHFSGPASLSLWYLPAGLMLAFLTRVGSRWIPWVFLTVALGGFVISPYAPNLLAGLPAALAYGLGAATLRRWTTWSAADGISVRDVTFLALVAVACSGASAAGTVWILTDMGTMPPSMWPGAVGPWWVGDLVGILALTPLLLLSNAQSVSHRPQPLGLLSLRRQFSANPWEVVGQAVLTLLTLELAVQINQRAQQQVLFLCFVPLLWVTLRSRTLGTVLWTFLSCLVITLLVWTLPSSADTLIEIQLLLATLSLSMLVLSVVESDRRAQLLEVIHHAQHDPLTGLLNHTTFLNHIHSWCEASTGERQLLLALIDASRLKSINDTLGHVAGDTYLVQLAGRLNSYAARTLDFPILLARFGGNEFVLAARVPSSQQHEFIDDVLQSLDAPVVINGHTVPLMTTVGVAAAPSDRIWIEALLKEADEAVHQAKREGRPLQWYQPSAQPGASALILEQEFREALQSGHGLRLHYQPLVSLATQQVAGFEALVRWQHPSRGMLFPGAFLPMAEQARLGSALGRWVLGEACAQLGRWTRAGHTIRIAVNVDVAHLLEERFLDDVWAALDAGDAPPERLEVELTERAMLWDPVGAAHTLGTLQRRGITVALDDFGTGFSSLSHLRTFQPQVVKIDRSFTEGLQARDMQIIQGIVNLGRALNVRVLIEGVETPAQLQMAMALGCDEAQGYLWSPAVPPDEAERWLQKPPMWLD